MASDLQGPVYCAALVRSEVYNAQVKVPLAEQVAVHGHRRFRAETSDVLTGPVEGECSSEVVAG